MSTIVEPVEQRLLLAAVTEHEGIAYFLSEATPEVQRYDIANEAWLTSVPLTEGVGLPTAVHVDDDGIYTSFGSTVYRYNSDGTGEVHLVNASSNVHGIHSDGAILLLNHSAGLYSNVISINKNTNTIIDTDRDYIESIYGSSISTELNRIFGRSGGVSPSDINYTAYDDNGNFTGVGESPYHGDYPGASQTWVFPDQSKVVDNSGTIYATDNLTYVNSFGGAFDDVAFIGIDIPVVLDDTTVTVFTSSILPAGSAELENAASEIFVNDDNVIAFRSDNGSWLTEKIPLSSLNPPEPGQPIDPRGLPYTPDKVVPAANGMVLLYSKAHQSIFQWDSERQEYGPTIPLIGSGSYFAYSETTHTAYLAYQSGLIRSIDLNQPDPAEIPFATLPQSPSGLSTAGQYVFAVDPSGAWVSHYTFDPDGNQISAVEWNYYSRDFVWSEPNQKMYFFRDSTSPRDLLWEEINQNGTAYENTPPGGIRNKKDSPLHSSSGFTHPIHVSPDGNYVVLGSGLLHNAESLARLTTGLSNSISDAAWLNNQLYTIREVSGNSQIQQWEGASFAVADTLQVTGTPVALLNVADNRLLRIIEDANGIPQFQVLDGDLENVPAPEGEITLTLSQSEVIESGDRITLTVQRSGPLTEPIVVTIDRNNSGEIKAPATITIPAEQDQVQVDLIIIDDEVADGTQQVNLTAKAPRLVTGRTSFDVLDNEPVVAHTLGNTTVSEDGSADAFLVRLDTQPTGDVVVQISPDNPDELSVNKPTLIFTPANWDQFQTVAVTGADDDLPDGPQDSQITVSVMIGQSAAEFTSAAPVSLVVTVLDDEPPRPVITSPASVTHGNAPTIAWEPMDEVNAYDIWLQRVGDTAAPGQFTTNQTQFTGHGRLQVGRYDLWVRGHKTAGGKTPWGYRRFTVDEPATLTSLPFHGHDRMPEISWSDVNGATNYQLWGSNITTGQQGVIDEVDIEATSFSPASEFSFGLHRFWVRPTGPGGFLGSWSQPMDYYVGPEITTPFVTTFDSRPELAWNAIPGAASYRLWASGTGGFIIDEREISGTSYTPTVDVPNGPLRWWLLPSTADNRTGRWSPRGEVHIAGAPVNPEIVGEDIDSTPALTWDAVGEAAYYQVFLQRVNDSQVVFNTQDINTNTLQLPFLEDADYRLWLRAFDGADNPGRWSAPFEFSLNTSTIELASVPVIPTTPTLETDVSFHWTAPDGADSYDLHLSDGNQVIEQENLSAATWLAENLPRSIWSWRVRARNAAGEAGPWSAPETVDTTGRAVFLTSGGQTNNATPTIHWSLVSGADSYIIFIQNQNTQTIARVEGITQSSYTPATPLEPSVYRFWVKALSDTNGTEGAWSLPIDLEITVTESDAKPMIDVLTSLRQTPESDDGSNSFVPQETEATTTKPQGNRKADRQKQTPVNADPTSSKEPASNPDEFFAEFSEQII